MSNLQIEQLELSATSGRVFGVLPVDGLPAAGDVFTANVTNFLNPHDSEELRRTTVFNRRACPVWSVGIEIMVDEASIIESTESEIIQPKENKRKRFRAGLFAGSAVIADELFGITGVVGETFDGVVELPDVPLDETDLPGLLTFMGQLPLDTKQLKSITNDMKPHEIKKATKLREAQQQMMTGDTHTVLKALRTINKTEGVPDVRPLIPTLDGWRSW